MQFFRESVPHCGLPKIADQPTSHRQLPKGGKHHRHRCFCQIPASDLCGHLRHGFLAGCELFLTESKGYLPLGRLVKEGAIISDRRALLVCGFRNGAAPVAGFSSANLDSARTVVSCLWGGSIPPGVRFAFPVVACRPMSGNWEPKKIGPLLQPLCRHPNAT